MEEDEANGKKVARIEKWIINAETVLNSQEDYEKLPTLKTKDIISNFKRILERPAPNFKLVSVISHAIKTLIKLSNKIEMCTREIVGLLQLLMSVIVSLISSDPNFPFINICEDISSLLLLVSAQVNISVVLDELIGYILHLVANNNLVVDARTVWLRTLHILLKEDSTEELRDSLRTEYIGLVDRLVDWIYTCGDVTIQALLVEVLLRLTSTSQRRSMGHGWFPNYDVVQSLFSSVIDPRTDVRTFLREFNSGLGENQQVFSYAANSFQVAGQYLYKPRHENYPTFWVDFNLSVKSISAICIFSQSSSDDEEWTTVTIPESSVVKAVLSVSSGGLYLRCSLSTVPVACFEPQNESPVFADILLTSTKETNQVVAILQKMFGEKFIREERHSKSKKNCTKNNGKKKEKEKENLVKKDVAKRKERMSSTEKFISIQARPVEEKLKLPRKGSVNKSMLDQDCPTLDEPEKETVYVPSTESKNNAVQSKVKMSVAHMSLSKRSRLSHNAVMQTSCSRKQEKLAMCDKSSISPSVKKQKKSRKETKDNVEDALTDIDKAESIIRNRMDHDMDHNLVNNTLADVENHKTISQESKGEQFKPRDKKTTMSIATMSLVKKVSENPNLGSILAVEEHCPVLSDTSILLDRSCDASEGIGIKTETNVVSPTDLTTLSISTDRPEILLDGDQYLPSMDITPLDITVENWIISERVPLLEKENISAELVCGFDTLTEADIVVDDDHQFTEIEHGGNITVDTIEKVTSETVLGLDHNVVDNDQVTLLEGSGDFSVGIPEQSTDNLKEPLPQKECNSVVDEAVELADGLGHLLETDVVVDDDQIKSIEDTRDLCVDITEQSNGSLKESLPQKECTSPVKVTTETELNQLTAIDNVVDDDQDTLFEGRKDFDVGLHEAISEILKETLPRKECNSIIDEAVESDSGLGQLLEDVVSGDQVELGEDIDNCCVDIAEQTAENLIESLPQKEYNSVRDIAGPLDQLLTAGDVQDIIGDKYVDGIKYAMDISLDITDISTENVQPTEVRKSKTISLLETDWDMLDENDPINTATNNVSPYTFENDDTELFDTITNVNESDLAAKRQTVVSKKRTLYSNQSIIYSDSPDQNMKKQTPPDFNDVHILNKMTYSTSEDRGRWEGKSRKKSWRVSNKGRTNATDKGRPTETYEGSDNIAPLVITRIKRPSSSFLSSTRNNITSIDEANLSDGYSTGKKFFKSRSIFHEKEKPKVLSWKNTTNKVVKNRTKARRSNESFKHSVRKTSTPRQCESWREYCRKSQTPNSRKASVKVPSIGEISKKFQSPQHEGLYRGKRVHDVAPPESSLNMAFDDTIHNRISVEDRGTLLRWVSLGMKLMEFLPGDLLKELNELRCKMGEVYVEL